MSNIKPLYQLIATELRIISDTKWQAADGNKAAAIAYRRADERLEQLERDHLPSGSGFDHGSMTDRQTLDSREVFRIASSYHHMNEAGFYCGWIHFEIFIRADMVNGFRYDLWITGNDIDDEDFDETSFREYAADTFCYALRQYIDCQSFGAIL